MRDIRKGLYKYIETMNPGPVKTIEEKKALDDDDQGRHEQDDCKEAQGAQFLREQCSR